MDYFAHLYKNGLGKVAHHQLNEILGDEINIYCEGRLGGIFRISH